MLIQVQYLGACSEIEQKPVSSINTLATCYGESLFYVAKRNLFIGDINLEKQTQIFLIISKNANEIENFRHLFAGEFINGKNFFKKGHRH